MDQPVLLCTDHQSRAPSPDTETGTQPLTPRPQSLYLAGRCQQVGLGHSAQGCYPAGRSQWKALGSLKVEGEVRDLQAGARSRQVPPGRRLKAVSLTQELCSHCGGPRLGLQQDSTVTPPALQGPQSQVFPVYVPPSHPPHGAFFPRFHTVSRMFRA